jgi:hypothetical protein
MLPTPPKPAEHPLLVKCRTNAEWAAEHIRVLRGKKWKRKGERLALRCRMDPRWAAWEIHRREAKS